MMDGGHKSQLLESVAVTHGTEGCRGEGGPDDQQSSVQSLAGGAAQATLLTEVREFPQTPTWAPALQPPSLLPSPTGSARLCALGVTVPPTLPSRPLPELGKHQCPAGLLTPSTHAGALVPACGRTHLLVLLPSPHQWGSLTGT